MLGATGIGSDKRQVDIGLHGGGKLHLGLFRRFFKPLKRHLVPAQIDPLVFFEFIGQIIDEPQVEVLATEVGVAVGGLDLEDPFADLQDADIESAAAQVENGDLLFGFFVEPIARDAAVGSLMIRWTLRPAILPASLVAWRWLSLK